MWGRRRRRPELDEGGHWPGAALDAAADGMLTIDERGLVTLANAAAGRLLGRDVDELVGADAHAVLPLVGADGEPYRRSQSPIVAGLAREAQPRTGQELILRPGGPPLGVELFTAPVRDGRRVVGALVSFRPVSVPGATDYGDEVLRMAERERAQREFLQQLQ
ncbi:MAG: PAS domain-containing protein, partial [Actinomycetota bacterium]|nr:PAS domain-containing protein [Actinomycetota bacterium]